MTRKRYETLAAFAVAIYLASAAVLVDSMLLFAVSATFFLPAFVMFLIGGANDPDDGG